MRRRGEVVIVVTCVASLLACGNGHTISSDGATADGPNTDAPRAPEPDDGAQSGSRLKLTYWVSGDGMKLWAGAIYDSQLGVPCTINLWSDGQLYCTPSYTGFALGSPETMSYYGWGLSSNPAAPSDRNGDGLRLAYTDAGCTQLVLRPRLGDHVGLDAGIHF